MSSSSPSTRSPTAAPASHVTSQATSCSSRGGCPVIGCGQQSPSASAPTPRRGRPRSSSPAPIGSPRSPIIRGRRGRCSPTSDSSRSRPSRSATRSSGSASSRASHLSRSSPPWSSGAIATSSSTRSGPDPDGELQCGFHAPGRWDEIVPITDCLLASEASNAARDRVVEWCRAQGLTAFDRRSGEGMLRNLVVREGRRTGQLQVRLATCHQAAGPRGADRGRRRRSVRAAADPARLGRRDDHRRDHRGARGRPALRRGARRDDLPHLGRRVLSDQHRDGRAALCAGRGVRPARPASSASSTSTAGSARSGC